MSLTAKMEKFAQCVADGMSQSDAYRASYSVINKAEKTIWEKASALAANGKVKARIAELKGKLEEKQLWTRSDAVKSLMEAMEIAKANESIPPMVQAIKVLNDMHGFNEPENWKDEKSPISINFYATEKKEHG